MKKEYAKHDEEFKKMIVNLCETNKDKVILQENMALLEPVLHNGEKNMVPLLHQLE